MNTKQTSADQPSTLNPQPSTISESVCSEADRIVASDRNRDYGHPLDDFSKTAGAFAALTGIVLTPEQVGLFMICVKLSRECNRHKRDNLVDIAGYAKTVQNIVEEKERRKG